MLSLKDMKLKYKQKHLEYVMNTRRKKFNYGFKGERGLGESR